LAQTAALDRGAGRSRHPHRRPRRPARLRRLRPGGDASAGRV